MTIPEVLALIPRAAAQKAFRARISVRLQAVR